MRPLALPVLLFASLASAAPAVFVAESAEKLRPGAATRPFAPAHIFAARNEFEAFQIAVAGPATSVRAVTTTLLGPGAPITEVRLYREGLVNCPQPSSPDGAAGLWPDPLIPDKDEFDNQTRNAFPFDVPAGELRAVFVDVYVPQGQTPGDYTGTVTIQSAQGNVDVPVTLTVWGFELPSTSSLRSAYRLQYGALPTQHGVSGQAFTDLRVRYGVMGLDHRISIGWFDDGDPSIAHFDANFAPLVAGTAATRLPGAQLTSVESQADAASWWSYASGKGWQKKLFNYTCDEPPMTCPWSSIPTEAAAIHGISPDFRTLVTTSIERANANGVTSSINLLVPEVNALLPRGAASTIGQYAAFQAQPNNEVWTYQSCDVHGCGTDNNSDPGTVGWPSIMVDASGTRNRAEEWFSFQLGLTGELYYETTQAYTDPGDPWTTLYVPSFSGNGDGTLFYPGTPARIGGTTQIPVASYRLKMIREASEDFEYLTKVAQLGGKSFALQVAKTLYPSSTATDVSVTDLMAARAQLAAYIVNATNPVPCSDGTAAGMCSANKPAQCVGGMLVPACGTCGCPTAQRCMPGGSCTPVPTYTAIAQSDLSSAPVISIGSTATVSAGWTASALYLSYEVTDSQLVAATGGEDTLWDSDSVEVMLDSAGSVFHVLVAQSGQVGDSRGWTDFSYSAMAVTAVTATANGYRVDLQLPWTPMGIVPSAGMTLGFDVAVNDRDGTAPTVSQDWAGLSAFNDPPAWGVLVLGAPPAVDAGSPAPDAGAADAGLMETGSGGGGGGAGGGNSSGGGTGGGGGGGVKPAQGGGGGGGALSAPPPGCGCNSGVEAVVLLAVILLCRRRVIVSRADAAPRAVAGGLARARVAGR